MAAERLTQLRPRLRMTLSLVAVLGSEQSFASTASSISMSTGKLRVSATSAIRVLSRPELDTGAPSQKFARATPRASSSVSRRRTARSVCSMSR